jgi:hypothetical protein
MLKVSKVSLLLSEIRISLGMEAFRASQVKENVDVLSALEIMLPPLVDLR